MSHKDKQTKKWTVVRRCVQFFILALFLLPVLVTGWGLFGLSLHDVPLGERVTTPGEFPFYGTLSSSSVGPITLIDPFVALQAIAASKTLETSVLLGLLPILLFFGLVRGRVFCGWVCPVNLILELIDALRNKLMGGKNLPEHVLPRNTKVVIAAVVLVLSAILSIPVWEMFNPVSFVIKGLVYGGIAGGLTLVAAILLDLFYGHRVWCRALCPMGGFYQILGKVGFVKVAYDKDACIHCGKCQSVCISDPEILEPVLQEETTMICSGDCSLCGKCIEICPKDALSIKVAPPTQK